MDGPDGTRHLLGQMEDITARRMVEEMLRRQAEHDSLTGLANRAHLARVLTQKAGAGAHCAVLFIDLDGFKLINDTRGHEVGDEVLMIVAQRLQASVRPTDLVARFGGDEFVVLCDAVDGADADGRRAHVADRIDAALAEPMATQSGRAVVTASIGIASGVVDADRPHDLVQRADAAMYEAKRLGKDRREIYDVRLHERARQHQRTEAALRNAPDRRSLRRPLPADRHAGRQRRRRVRGAGAPGRRGRRAGRARTSSSRSPSRAGSSSRWARGC